MEEDENMIAGYNKQLKRKSSDKLLNISNQLNNYKDGNMGKVVKKIEDITGTNKVVKKRNTEVKKYNVRSEKSPISHVEKSSYTLSRERSKNIEDKSKSPYKINNSKFINKKM